MFPMSFCAGLHVTSPYRILLGDAFDTLPESLRCFHDVRTDWRGHARFRITRGRGWLRNLVARAGRLPPAGEDVPVRLRIVAEGNGERWLREFGDHRLESFQQARDGLLVEAPGPITLGFRLVVKPPALYLHPARAWIFGIPWPLALAPRGTGVEVGQEDGCAIVVTAMAPWLGEIVRYEGTIREQISERE
jgi:hypothetical protein